MKQYPRANGEIKNKLIKSLIIRIFTKALLKKKLLRMVKNPAFTECIYAFLASGS